MHVGVAPRQRELIEFLSSPGPRSVPPDLATRAKRHASPIIGIVFGSCFAILGAFFVATFFPWEFWKAWQLQRGPTASGAGRIVMISELKLSINETRVWQYVFEFRPEGGTIRRGECFTTGRRWQENERVAVRYLVRDPNIAVIEGARTTTASWIGACTVLFPVAGLAIAVITLQSRRRALWLLQAGTAARATVVALHRTLVHRNYRPVYKVELHVAGAAWRNVTIKRHEPEIIRFLESRQASGEQVWVLYDPARPKRLLLPEIIWMR